MLRTTLNWLEPELLEILNNKKDVDAVINNLSIFKGGYWIYPGLLKRKLKMPIKTVYSVLNLLEEKGMIKHYYEVICPQCTKSIGEFYPNLDSIPEYVECDHCGNGIKILAIKSAYLIYMVNDNV